MKLVAAFIIMISMVSAPSYSYQVLKQVPLGVTSNVSISFPSSPEMPKYQFMDPNLDAIKINPEIEKYQFEEETALMKSHRWHYVAYWALFFGMRATRF